MPDPPGADALATRVAQGAPTRVPLTVEPHQLNDPVGGKWLSSLSAYSACQRQRYQRFDLVAERGW